jgi:D-alanyl-lipoteichoic acid acyltransferase DltB (MBOAT superfamily)
MAPSRAVREAELLYLLAPKQDWTVGPLLVVAVTGVILSFVALSQMSSACRDTPDCVSRLSPGWIPGLPTTMDLTDHQWTSLREGLPLLCAAFLALAVLSRVVRWFVVSPSASVSARAEVKAANEYKDPAPRALVWFYAAVGVVFTFALVGADSVFIFLIIALTVGLSNVPLTRNTAKFVPLLHWAHLGGWMVFVGLIGVYRWRVDITTLFGESAAWLRDALPSRYRWTSLFNIIMLKLLSFGLDKVWSVWDPSPQDVVRHPTPDEESRPAHPSPGRCPFLVDKACEEFKHPPNPLVSWTRSLGLSMRKWVGIDVWDDQAMVQDTLDGVDTRASTPRQEEDYDAVAAVAFALYPPLLIAGPTLTFNTFMSQLRKQRPGLSHMSTETIWYCVRWGIAWFFLEAWLHLWPVYAMNAASVNVCDGIPQTVVPPADRVIAAVAGCHSEPLMEWFSVLHTLVLWEMDVIVLWLKFVVLWRFFRAWALVDGIECEENQPLCVFMASSIAGFWKGWHRSFNRWLVRYMFIPLGGSRSSTLVQILSSAFIFVFVAVWHEFSPKLVVWGLVFGLLSIPEVLMSKFIHHSKSAWATSLRHSSWFPLIGALQGVMAIGILILGNIAGFGSGLHGLQSYAARFNSLAGAGAWVINGTLQFIVVLTSSAIRAARGYDVHKPSRP